MPNRLATGVGDLLATVILRGAAVTGIVDHGPFRVVTVEGEELRSRKWSAGDKVQIRVSDSVVSLRTYTPVRWDNATGTTELIVYQHDATDGGPATAWAAALEPGDRIQMFGPRRSLRLDDLGGPPVFVGDETSVALRTALAGAHPTLAPAVDVFEVAHAGTVAVLGPAFGITGPTVVRTDDDSHLVELTAAVRSAVEAHPGAPLVLTGRSTTIAEVRRELKAAGLSTPATRVKAYWDPKRAGLD